MTEKGLSQRRSTLQSHHAHYQSAFQSMLSSRWLKSSGLDWERRLLTFSSVVLRYCDVGLPQLIHEGSLWTAWGRQKQAQCLSTRNLFKGLSKISSINVLLQLVLLSCWVSLRHRYPALHLFYDRQIQLHVHSHLHRQTRALCHSPISLHVSKVA